MKRSMLKLRASLVPAIFAAACALGLLMHQQGATESGQHLHEDGQDGSAVFDQFINSKNSPV